MKTRATAFEIFSELNLSYPNLAGFSVICNITDKFALRKPSAPDHYNQFSNCFISFIRNPNEVNVPRRQYNYLGATLEKVTTKGFIAYAITKEFARVVDDLKVSKVLITVNKSTKTYIYPNNSTKMIFEDNGQLYFGIELDKFYIPAKINDFHIEIKTNIEYYAEYDEELDKFITY